MIADRLRLSKMYKIYQYQYDGLVPFDDVLSWCKETLDYFDYWTNYRDSIWLKSDEAAALFMLRWS